MATIAPNQSIQSVIDANPAGTTFEFAAGTWREQEFLTRSGDQFVGDPDGGTILSGARVLTNWQRSSQRAGERWRCSGLPAPLTDNKPVFDGSLANQRNDLFIDDVLQQRVGSNAEVTSGKWWFDPNGNAAVIATDPAGHTIEYSVTANQTWDNNATGVLWENITVEKYATEAQNGAHHGMKGWTYKNATFRHMHGAGVNIGADTVVDGGRFIDNGQCGVEGYGSHNAKVMNAEIARNGFIGYNTDWDGGGLKICGSDNVHLIGNHVHHNKDQGLWGDIDCTNWLYEDNTVEDNTGCGIMYEISYGETRIVNNHCARNGGVGGYGAGGIYVSNSSGVDVSGNTIEVKPGNTAIGGGVSIINDDRGSGNQGIYEARNVNVHHNQITHTDDTAMNGYWVYQAITNPGIAFDNNTYRVKNPSAQRWRLVDRDVSWDELRAAGQEPGGTLTGLDDAPPIEQPPVDPPVEQPPAQTLAPGTYKIEAGATLIVGD